MMAENNVEVEETTTCCGLCGKRKKPEPKPASIQSPAAEQSPKIASKRDDSEQSSIRTTELSMQLAAAKLGLSKKEQLQVQKALEAEMERRKRWRRLLKNKGLKRMGVATGPKTPGETQFPISIEDVLSGVTPSKTSAHESTPEMVAELEQSENLELKRKAWIHKMQTRPGPSPSPKKSQSDSQKSKSGSTRTRSKSSSDQPESISIDDAAAKEIAGHTLLNMLHKVIEQQPSVKEDSVAEKAKEKKKKPSEMNPEELIEWRRRHPKAWDEMTNANSVISFGLAKPTPDDEKKGREVKKQNKKRERKPLTFDNKITVANIPAGDDFELGEKPEMETVRVSFEPDILKKR